MGLPPCVGNRIGMSSCIGLSKPKHQHTFYLCVVYGPPNIHDNTFIFPTPNQSILFFFFLFFLLSTFSFSTCSSHIHTCVPNLLRINLANVFFFFFILAQINKIFKLLISVKIKTRLEIIKTVSSRVLMRSSITE